MKVRRIKIAAILTLVGTATFALYTHFNLGNPLLAIISITLLFAPATYLATSSQVTNVTVYITTMTVATVQSAWLFGNGYIQGTDAPNHLQRLKEFFQDGSIHIFVPARSLSEQAPYFYTYAEMTSTLTNMTPSTQLLLFAPIFAVATLLSYYILLKLVFSTRHAVLASVFLSCSTTFLNLGIEPRTASMAIPFLILAFYSLLKERDSRGHMWFAILTLLVIALPLTHTLITLQFLGLGALALLISSIDFPFAHVHYKTNVELYILSTIIVSIILSQYIYLTGSIGQLAIELFAALVGIFTILEGIGAPRSSGAAQGSGAGPVVFVAVWISRLLFIAAAGHLSLKTAPKVFRGQAAQKTVFILFASWGYLAVVIFIMFAGDAIGLNPGRMFRGFEYFSAIIIAYTIVRVIDWEDATQKIKRPIVVGVVVLLAIGSITTMTVWTVDTGLREGGVEPYVDYNTDDIQTTMFANQYVDSNTAIYGDERSRRLFGAYSKRDIIRGSYTPPNSTKVQNQDRLLLPHRVDGGQYVQYEDEFLENSNTIYSNGGVELRSSHSDRLIGNVTYPNQA